MIQPYSYIFFFIDPILVFLPVNPMVKQHTGFLHVAFHPFRITITPVNGIISSFPLNIDFTFRLSFQILENPGKALPA